MMEAWVITLLVLAIVGAIIGLSFLIIHNRRKWSCTDQGCELVLGGDYSSHPECKKACDDAHKAADEGEADDEASSSEGEEDDEPDHSFACAANGQCIPVKGKETAPFTTMGHCANSCKPPVRTVLVNPYYPQSMFPRPWRRRRHRRRHSRGKKDE
jgi:hypothetical protein